MESLKKRPFATAFVVIAFGFIFITILNSSSDSPVSSTPLQEPAPAATSETEVVPTAVEKNSLEVIDFNIVYTDSKSRFDGGTKYYVLIDPIDISNADFKKDIQNIAQKLVSDRGRKISLDIFDDRKALDVMYKQYGDMSLGRARTESENELVGRHLIASVDVGLSTMPDEISFFPGTFKSNPEVGKYVETISF